ncbi:sucrose-6-phosphate hydrolase [Nosocomiicoccus sp. HMSC09A07]|uniref:sucrose-6-phosphate hydrolase n=1 Tax=Nosocomiicoccus sp. HMSC09A07 TaxID=1581145 RepID=UPI0008A52EB3|nr:sucrose-6-phosphate hydrolase [Nosocomiicoccus sp. HMSC09A07]OFS61857.1 hypothetical protein HMPREF3177_07180 [Nosocomiicoccus sp. HMSC09A07]
MKRIEDYNREQIETAIESSMMSKWRLNYHVQPVMGILGAPCGFFYINGLYHIFYEWEPATNEESATYLYHVTSENLIHFNNEGIKLRPDDLYDKDNLYGGNLTLINNELTLFFTGEQQKSDGVHTYQRAGVIDTDFKIKKYPAPILREVEPGYKQYFRNPYVFTHDGEINMMIGTMNDEEFGRIIMYRGKSLEDLKFLGEVNTGYDMFGYFWESPELFTLDDAEVLMFNPRGLDKFKHHFWNIYQSGYVINDFEYGSLFVNHDDYREFDGGFDFYRPVTTLDSEGRRVLIAWMSAEESKYPTEIEGYKNALTIPRVLTVNGDRLIQTPHPHLKELRRNELKAIGYFNEHRKPLTDFYGDSYELIIDIKENNARELFFLLRKSNREETIVSYNSEEQKITLDRTFSGALISGVDGTTRSIELTRPLERLQIFMDRSSIEIFINDGEHTLTARIFPREESIGVEVMAEDGDCYVEMTHYTLKGFKEDPVISQRKKI